MGRAKATLRLGQRTLLGHARRTAHAVGLSVRIIRKDIIPRCGPLSGIYTALQTSPHEAELFLSCDMPFVTTDLLKRLIAEPLPIFVEHKDTVGFPFMLAVSHMAIVEEQIRSHCLSLQNLAERLNAKRLHLHGAETRQLFNVNTPADWSEAVRCRAELPLSMAACTSIVLAC